MPLVSYLGLTIRNGQLTSKIKIPNNRIELVNLIFTQLEVTYHNQFHKAYPDKNSLNLAKQLWLTQLQKFDEKIVFESVGKLMTTSDFLPTLSKVINYCIESKLKSNGIPNVNYAYKEACHSRNNFEKFSWSHPIIFYIGSKTGWDYLWTQAEKETFKEFKLNYDFLVNEYLDGKEFSKPNFPELPKTLKVKVNKKSQLKKIQDLKNKLIN